MMRTPVVQIGPHLRPFIHLREEILLNPWRQGAHDLESALQRPARLRPGDVPKTQGGMAVGMDSTARRPRTSPTRSRNNAHGSLQAADKYRNASILLPQDMLRLHTLAPPRRSAWPKRSGRSRWGKFADFCWSIPRSPTRARLRSRITLVFVCNNANVDTVSSAAAVVRRGRP